MKAFNELRQAARDRRDRIIIKAREEYESTLARIAVIEQDLLGRDHSTHKSIAAAVGSVIPTDGTFTAADVLRSLEAMDPRRSWRKRSVDCCISRLRAEGIVKRLSKAKAGAAHTTCGAVYVRVGVAADAGPFGDMPFVEVLHETLEGKALTLTELIVAILEAGYRTVQKPRALREHAGATMRKDTRFIRAGDRWSVR